MRALLVLLVLAIAVPAAADEPAPAAPTKVELPRHGRVDGVAINPNDLPISDLDQGRGVRRPSGFWTGYRPARSGAYRWPLLGLAVVIVAITALLLRRLLRKTRPATS
jgi:hypothetical protein